MKKHVKILLWISIISASINFLWLGYDFYLFNRVPLWFENLNYYEPYLKLIDWSLVSTFLGHILIFITTIIVLNNINKMHLAGSIMLLLGFLSFLSIYLHFACLHDIVHEYPQGWADGEINFGRGIQIFQMIFFLFTIVYFVYVFKYGRTLFTTERNRSEKLFIAYNLSGIICGVAGIAMVILYASVGRPIYKFEIIPFGFVLLPYTIALVSWQLIGRDNKISINSGNYKSIKRIVTIIAKTSIPVIIVLYFIYFDKASSQINMLIVPMYVFIILLLLSVSSLYNLKKGDGINEIVTR